MKSKNEVSLNEALLALKYAISNAWADTRRQVKASSYDPRIVQTAFGQFLVHNVMNRIYQLNEDYQSMTAELRPNSSNTAYHVAIRLEDTLLTVSAIPHENLRPVQRCSEKTTLQGKDFSKLTDKTVLSRHHHQS